MGKDIDMCGFIRYQAYRYIDIEYVGVKMQGVKISELTLRRLPKYRQYLIKLRKEGVEYTSASEISRELDVHHTQVRKDLQATGLRGIPKVGHRVEDLITGIEEFLNWNNTSDAFLVGVGHIGRALLNYEGFERVGIKIVAAFDIDPEITGTTILETPVFDLSKLVDLGNRLHTRVGIITTTPSAAQDVAEKMVEAGIIAIWNFTPVKLKLSENIIVENANIYPSLAVLSHRVAEYLKK